MELGDSIINSGNKWYLNTERRIEQALSRIFLGIKDEFGDGVGRRQRGLGDERDESLTDGVDGNGVRWAGTATGWRWHGELDE